MTVPSDLLAALDAAPLLADGAMGTMLFARGVGFDACLEDLNRSRPELVAAVHRGYVESGARLLCTNTFGANRYRLRAHGMETQVKSLNGTAVAIARDVCASAAGRIWIAGDVGPVGARIAPYGRLGRSDVHAAFVEQIESLVAAGVDAVLVETMGDLREMAEAVRAARGIDSSLPVIATMTFTRDDFTLLGEGPEAVAVALAEMGADVIGVNCAAGPAQALRLLWRMRSAAPTARLAVKPNAGWPERVGGRLHYPATPAYFAECARAFADAGAALIGGCCGTTPEHIAAMSQALLSRNPRASPSPAASIAIPAPTIAVAPHEPPTELARKLAAGRFVVSVEMDPPRGPAMQALLAGAQLLSEAGADVINVADSPMARMRMSPWAVCHLVQREVGLETVLHFPLRGRSLLRVQGDLLAAHALGIRNLFAVMGDPTEIGDHPGASDAYDLVPSGLIRLVKQGLNAGAAHAGAGIAAPTSFFVGCALNLAAADTDKEIRGLRKKIDAGADFALTQPVYEADAARRFLARYATLHGRLDLPLLIGVLPLYNERHAAFLHNEVPGITIPDPVRRRMAGAGRDEGVRIAVELIGALRGVAAGVYLMPPFGRYDMAAEIVDAIER